MESNCPVFLASYQVDQRAACFTALNKRLLDSVNGGATRQGFQLFGYGHIICSNTSPHGVIIHLEYDIMGKRITITILIIVIAAAWNQNGEISAVDIAGYDEKRYRIADDHVGSQLKALIKKRVVVDGIVGTKKNLTVIHIHHFLIDTTAAATAGKISNGRQPPTYATIDPMVA